MHHLQHEIHYKPSIVNPRLSDVIGRNICIEKTGNPIVQDPLISLQTWLQKVK